MKQNKDVKVTLSQQWQVLQKPDKTGKQYPPIIEKLEVEMHVPIEQLSETYTYLNTKMFEARLNHMKSLKQKQQFDGVINNAGKGINDW